ncbi:Predicted dehydrogenase [Virgibacillus subterraneus]|uniref:Predicted dehydrogenase n=1 Tax=Virgibacillus subterraneus TaxID=621109 RepID=A0A1H9G6N0_9BACI|nr:Gfo/Idh/MocA family oxidoreductase [Virgibacillus subterraneus]SEQ45741.1 Predicted dehydrogenase [Virgibacillus subterraneus]
MHGETNKALVLEGDIRLAMLGMVDGNGHPYSWSAIFNGYNKEEMKACPFSGIPDYLEKQPAHTFGIDRAKVTHIWTDDSRDAGKVSNASFIPHIVDKAEDVIGEVDAVIVATDKGYEHVDRCRPFVEAGLPIFVDKPLVDNEQDLKIFSEWVSSGSMILSSSGMRYCKEFMPYRHTTHELGELRSVSITTAKTWERYGIHALESIYPIVGSGFISAVNTGSYERNVVHFKHECGADIVVTATQDMFGGSGLLQLCGTKGHVQTKSEDSYFAFKSQLESFIYYLRTGERPFPFAETTELMKMIIAGIRSRELGGKEVLLADISEC